MHSTHIVGVVILIVGQFDDSVGALVKEQTHK